MLFIVDVTLCSARTVPLSEICLSATVAATPR